MPIEVDGEIRIFSQDEFHEVDREVMGIVFRVHNRFGRFLDEFLFKREIVAQCKEAGIVPVNYEVGISVRQGTFTKVYRMDMLFHRGIMFEVKAAGNIAPAHRNQVLNYLFLTGMHHGKLVNLRPERVQWEFVSTRLTEARRKTFTIDEARWRDVSEASRWLKETMVDLLRDWGAFLDVALYREAICHFLGGVEVVIRAVEVYSDDRLIGRCCEHVLVT